MGKKSKGSGNLTGDVRPREKAVSDREVPHPPTPLHTIVDAVPVLISYIDADHRYTYVNKAYSEWFGAKPEEINGRHLSEMLGDEDYKEVLPEIKRALRGERLEFERYLTSKDGSRRFVRVTYSPDIAEDGEVRGFFGLVMDATEQHEAKRALKESEERYRAFIEQSSEGIWRFEMDEPLPLDLPIDEQVRWAYTHGYLAECNDAMARQYGFESARELEGIKLGDLLVEDDPSNSEFLKAFFASGYRLNDAESHERDAHGNDRFFLNNFVGFIEDGRLARAWGTQRDITETKNAARATAHLAAIVESSDDAIIGKDLEGLITSWNDAAARLFGYSAAEVLGKHVSILMPAERAKEAAQIVARISKGERVENFETERQHKSGRIIPISLTVSPIKDALGTIIGASKIARDISEAKKAQEAQDRYRLLSMQARDIILFLEPNSGRIMDANRAAIETYGYDHASLLKMNISDLRSPETHKTLKKQYETANRQGTQFETVHIKRDGTRFPVEVSAVGSDVGTERIIISIIRDITERRVNEEARKESQLALERSEANLRDFLESASVAMHWVDANGVIIWANKAELEMLGYKPEEYIGRPIAEFHVDKDVIDDILKRLSCRETLQEYEARLRRKDGSICYGLINSNVLWQGDEFIHTRCFTRDITERKVADSLLKESEERFSKAFNASPLSLTISSLTDGRLVEVNDTFVKVTGYSRDQAIGKTTIELGLWSKPEDREAELEAVRQLGQLTNAEYSFRTKNGEEIIGLLAAEQIEIGGETFALTVIQDITERKRAEDKVRQNEATLRAYYNSSPLMMGIVELTQDNDIKHVYDNPATKAFFGIGEDATSTGRASELGGASKARQLWIANYRRSQEEDQPVHFEYEQEVRGKRRWLSSTVSCIGEAAPGLTRFSYVADDKTDDKLAQEALIKAERKAAEEYQELLQRIVPLGETLGTARDLRTVYKALQEFICASMECSGFFISFYDEENGLRHPAYVWGEGDEIDITTLPPMPIKPDGGPNSQAIFQKRTVITDRYWDTQKNRPHVIVNENGRNPMSSIVVPMMMQNRVTGTLEVQAYADGAFNKEHGVALEMAVNLAAVAIDNVRLIENEAKARAEAEAANRMKDEFLSVLSHELRTPLNAMLGWVRILRAGNLDEERAKKALEIIERNTRQQSSLIEDLLDVSRIISGKMRIEQELVDLLPSLEQVAESIKPLAMAKDVAFDVRATDEPLYLNGDSVRLQQVITNLLQNALKFTPSGGKVTLAFQREGQNAVIKVSDTGVGIEEEFLPLIFDRFSQADASTRRSNTGLGLGLTIVRNIVELHGGMVSVKSDGQGKGAEFTVTLPLAEEYYRPGSSSGAHASGNGHSASLEGIKILLVDDDPESLLPLRILLERENAIVDCAGSAGEALELLDSQDFNILISDIGMPSIDGYELISTLRRDQNKRNAGIKAIAFTAYASQDDRQRVLLAGYHAHLSKPLDFDALLVLIRNLGTEVIADQENV